MCFVLRMLEARIPHQAICWEHGEYRRIPGQPRKMLARHDLSSGMMTGRETKMAGSRARSREERMAPRVVQCICDVG